MIESVFTFIPTITLSSNEKYRNKDENFCFYPVSSCRFLLLEFVDLICVANQGQTSKCATLLYLKEIFSAFCLTLIDVLNHFQF